MKRFFFFTFLFLCFSIAVPSFAQDTLSLRVGAREGYARITFGWKDDVRYTLDQGEQGKITIAFDRSALIDPSAADFSSVGSVAAMQILSRDPLKLSFSIPKGSDVRDFKIGKRVVLDVYDPEDKAALESFKADSQVKVEQAKKPEKQEESEQKKEPEKDVSKIVKKDTPVEKTHKRLVEEKMPASPPAFVLVPEHLSESGHEKDHQEQNPAERSHKDFANVKPAGVIKESVKQENHVVSVRSTQASDVAAFESYGVLWFVIGNRSSYVVPGFTSPTPEIFSDFRSVKSSDVGVYNMDLPETPLPMKAKGGGLVWDLIMGDKVKENDPVKPVRRFPDGAALRGGKILWPLKHVGHIIDLPDPVTGQVLKVVTVEDGMQFSGAAQSFVDFDVLRSPIGMAIRPKTHGLKVKKTSDGVEISRVPGGLALSPSRDVDEARLFAQQQKDRFAHTPDGHGDVGEGYHGAEKGPSNNFFRFHEWQNGSVADLSENENILLSGMKQKSEARQIEDLLSLGKMFLSHGRAAESLGYFNYALAELPELYKSPEFRALSGVSKALDWKSDAALKDLLHKDLQNQDEVKYWKSFVLADLGDWQQAARVLPTHYKPIYDYPDNIANRLALVLAEVNLRDGRVENAEELMALVENHHDGLFDPQKAALKYLRGEASRQNGKIDKAGRFWEALTQDIDDLYRTKAGLALTILLARDKKITNEEAIDRLERLRYAWRGDELEAQVNYWLGSAYFEDGQFLKGLSIMRDAASIAGSSDLGQRIADRMAKTFKDLFLKDGLKDVSALDAVALYEQFTELTPVGAEGDLLIQVLAERLVGADLLGRATKLLRHQVDHRLKGEDKLRIALRLAAIELIDKNPQKAMDALGKASDTLTFLSDTPENLERRREIDFLKIRAYFQNKQFDKALSLLEKVPVNQKSNRLRADIAWRAGYWEEAADALNAVLIDENLSMMRPLTQEQSALLLNRAIALSLSNDRIALANMRQKYSDLMLQTHKAHQFEMITRPRHNSFLADRETLLSIVSEVDLFKNFLESYRAGESAADLSAANDGKTLN